MKKGGYERRRDVSANLTRKHNLRKRPVRKCLACQKILKFAHGNALYCGDRRKKTGCAYKAKILYDKKWKSAVKYYTRPNRREKQNEYSRNYYWKLKRPN